MPWFPRLMRGAAVLSDLWHGPLLILFSLPFLLGWRTYQKVNAYVDASARATGRVVNVVAQEKTDADGNRQTYYYPVVEFTTPDRKTIRFQDSTGVAPAYPAPHPGEKVPVLYNPENPHVAMVATWSNLWLLPAVFLGSGSFIALMGLLFFLGGILSLVGVTVSLTALTVTLLHGRRHPKRPIKNGRRRMTMQKHVTIVMLSLLSLALAVGGVLSPTASASGHFTDYGQPVPNAVGITDLVLGPDGLIYGVTCSTRLFTFNPLTQTFADKGLPPGDCPLDLTWGPDGLLYGGGWQSVLWSYDPRTGTFSARGTVPGGRRIIGLTTGPDGRLYVGSEPEADRDAKGRLFAFDPRTNTFTDLGGVADEPSVGYGLITGPDGKIYGGTFRDGHFFIYDPDSGTLTDKGQPMPGISSVSTLTVSSDGKIYGGINGNGHVFAYDPATDTFADKGQAVAGHMRVASLVALGSKIYGGTEGFNASAPGHLFVYDIPGGTFTDLGAPVDGERIVDTLLVWGLRVYGGTSFGGHFFSYSPPLRTIFLPLISR